MTAVAKHNMGGASITVDRVETGVYELIFDDGRKISIPFQRGVEPRVAVNGVTLEVLTMLLMARLEEHQNGPYPCEENATALAFYEQALEALKNREERLEREAKEAAKEAERVAREAERKAAEDAKAAEAKAEAASKAETAPATPAAKAAAAPAAPKAAAPKASSSKTTSKS